MKKRMTILEIAEKHHVSDSTVRRVIDRAGLKPVGETIIKGPNGSGPKAGLYSVEEYKAAAAAPRDAGKSWIEVIAVDTRTRRAEILGTVNAAGLEKVKKAALA